MREITLDVIAACNVDRDGAGTSLSSHLQYNGGGSSLGGSRLNPVGTFAPNGQQQVAPQSRFLSAAECGYFGPNAGQGIQIGLDGIGVYHDDTELSPCRVLRYAGKMPIRDLNRATAALDLNGDGDTTDPLEGPLGYGLGKLGLDDGANLLADDPATTDCNEAVEYCFRHWADVLRIIYTGLTSHVDDSAPVSACRSAAPSASPASARRCNSDIRHTLISDWANMFDSSGDDGAGGCADDTCPTGLSHAFRRDDFSGTTDTFLSLIGAPNVGTTAAPQRTFCNGIENEDLDPIRRVCTINASSALNDPVSACSSVPMRLRNLPFDATTGNPTGGSTTTLVTAPPANTAGDLGLVLAIRLPNTTVFDKRAGVPANTVLIDPVSGQPYNPQYDTDACSSAAIGGTFKLAEMPFTAAINMQRCPNGNPRASNRCLWPVQRATLTGGAPNPKAGWFNCKVSRTNRQLPAVWTNYDAREYNAWPRNPTDGTLLLPDSTSIGDHRFVVPGIARLHMSLPETTLAGHPACRQPDATTQIGCLVQSDPCAIGYAGLEAEDQDVDASEVAIAGLNLPFWMRAPLDADPGETNDGDDLELEPRVSTIQRLADPADIGTGTACSTGVSDFDIRYPLARILWLNSAKGFGGAGAFPGSLGIIANQVDSDPDFTQVDPTVVNGSGVPDGVPDLRTRENDFVQCYTNRALVDPILQAHGFITLPLAQPASARLRTCP